jgi:hypothetical protein
MSCPSSFSLSNTHTHTHTLLPSLSLTLSLLTFLWYFYGACFPFKQSRADTEGSGAFSKTFLFVVFYFDVSVSHNVVVGVAASVSFSLLGRVSCLLAPYLWYRSTFLPVHIIQNLGGEKKYLQLVKKVSTIKWRRQLFFGPFLAPSKLENWSLPFPRIQRVRMKTRCEL